MVAMSRSLGSAALLVAGGQALRRGSGGKQEVGDASHVVTFKQGTTTSDIREFCGGACGLMGDPDAGGVAFAQLPGGAGAQAMSGAMAKKVEAYEVDATDYMIPELDNNPVTSTASWGLDRIGVPNRGFTGRGQTIYVQDTGVRITHNDFGGRALAGLDLTTGQGVEVCDESSLTCSADRQGHGTHCAGTAAGTIYGVASGATVRSVKTLSDQGSGARSWQFAAIDWVTVNGVRPSVISMSLGGTGTDPAYPRAIGAATAAGITVVVAGGNSNRDACGFSPAFAEEAITVGATTSRDARASYSNWGTCTNIWAPGSSIASAAHTSDTGGRSLSGTSMACPHVSGAAALLLEEDPSRKSSEILAEMMKGAVLDAISGLKYNDTNALLYVDADGPPPTPVPVPTPAPSCDERFSTGPNERGDCVCNSGLRCREPKVMMAGCPYSFSQQRPSERSSTRYFKTCHDCICVS